MGNYSFKHLALFNGIGGFQLAADWMGWENVAHVEINDWCNKVVKQHFPNSKCYTDIKNFNGLEYAGTIDIISGGFPCQPFSVAGKQKGNTDDRYLWPEMLRVIREIQPTWVVGENVPGIINMELDKVLDDLESEGYKTQTFIIPATGVGAWHKRERIWIIANNNSFGGKFGSANSKIKTKTASERSNIQLKTYRLSNKPTATNTPNTRIESLQKRENGIYESFIITNTNGSGFQTKGAKQQTTGIERNVSDTEGKGLEGANTTGGICANGRPLQFVGRDRWATEPGICGVVNGIPNRVDRIKGLGNAIVPQVAYELFKAIKMAAIADKERGENI